MKDINTLIGVIEKIVSPMFKYAIPRIGRVEDVKNDKGKVLVTIPALGWDSRDKGAWCFPTDKKSLVVPDVGDYVIVKWIDANPDLPIYEGIPTMIKDQIPSSYDGDPKTKILFDQSNGDVIKYIEGELTFDMSGDILLGEGATKGVARNGDSTTSSVVEDSIFWTWLAAAGVVLAGLGVVAPVPTSLTGKVNQGSSKVKAVD